MTQHILKSNIHGEGKPFLILHGFLGMGDNWKTLGKRFSETGFQVHLIDQRNHGHSFHSDQFDYESMSKDLKKYIHHHSIESCVMLGHSMGGKTAMLFSTMYPNMIERLIVADISPRFYPVHHDAILEGLSSLDFSKVESRGEADEALSKYVTDFGTRQFLLKNLYWKEKGQLALRMNLEVLKEQVSEVGEALPLHSKFEKPTLFLRGDKSEYVMPNDESLIKQHFPFAEIKTVSNAGHWLHAENPNGFYDEVINFLN